jgi:hypothetical protein
VIRALLLIFDPAATWDRIIQARRGIPHLLATYIVPLLLLVGLASGFCVTRWGVTNEFGERIQLTSRQTAIYEAALFLVNLLVIFGSAKTVKALGETFHSGHTLQQAFTAVVYGLGPIFMLKLLQAFNVSPIVPWVIGSLVMFTVLYHGVPKVMEPDPSHAFGLYLATSVLLTLMTGVAVVAELYGGVWLLRRF